MHSNLSRAPPPPHRPQAHFYAAPELNVGLKPAEAEPSSTGTADYCAFDSVPSLEDDTLAKCTNVLLLGSGGAIEVHALGKKRLERVGRLAQLRGRVLNAKILPQTIHSRASMRSEPLVALVIHGPSRVSDPKQAIAYHQEYDEFDASGSMIQALETMEVSHYQTSVEIYSLRSGEYVSTLLETPKVEIRPSRYPERGDFPPSAGGIHLQARGKYVIITSATSGEVFVYNRRMDTSDDQRTGFRYIGKFWTRVSLKTTRSGSVSSRDSGCMQEEEDAPDATAQPIVALSSRWLAITPPSPSSQTSLHAHIRETLGIKVPGASLHASPAEPQVMCQLDTPETESLMNRIARDATQEFVKGARWVGNQGLQAWNSYWSKPSESNQQPPLSSSPTAPYPAAAQSFPPTHAPDARPPRARNSPAIVSIIDLNKLSNSEGLKESVALLPLATFSLPNGCSFVSFAPHGLQLFTASTKGDVQQVWDLMRVIHGDTSFQGDRMKAIPDPVIREVARFTRITEARIVDVTWTSPAGKRLALVTDNGTVHIYDLPSSAFDWPPPRQKIKVPTVASAQKREEMGETYDSGRSEPAGATFSSAWGRLSGTSQPLLSAVRGRTSSSGSSLPSFTGLAATAGIGAKGGKAVAAGINRSFTAAASGTVSTIRHLGENRINLPGSSKLINPSCIKWLDGSDGARLAVTGAGVVRLHGIQQSNNAKAGKRRPSAIGNKPTEFAIPLPTTEVLANDSSREADPPDSFWALSSVGASSDGRQSRIHPLSHAEIETHAPYQPFHTDARVNVYVYTDVEEDEDPHRLRDDVPWAFGDDIAAMMVHSGATMQDKDMDERNQEQTVTEGMESSVHIAGNEEEGRQIVVTTRRKRRRKDDELATAVDDGEFFEDDLEVVDFAHDRV